MQDLIARLEKRIQNPILCAIPMPTIFDHHATWLEMLGIQAYGVMGHSLGEITAAGRFILLCTEPPLTVNTQLPDGFTILVTRARWQQSLRRRIGLLNISPTWVCNITIYNAVDNNVVSGGLKAIEKLISVAKRDGIRATKLAVAQGKKCDPYAQ